jgi:hypothetical protein
MPMRFLSLGVTWTTGSIDVFLRISLAARPRSVGYVYITDASRFELSGFREHSGQVPSGGSEELNHADPRTVLEVSPEA